MAKKRKEKEAVRPSSPVTGLGGSLGGQRLRLSSDNPLQALAGVIPLAPRSADEEWRFRRLDSDTLERLSPADLIELLADISPDLSRALWDFLRLSNPGWEAKAFPVSPKAAEPDPRAQAALDAFLQVLKERYGSADVLFNRLYVSAFIRGGFFAELVLDQAGRMPIDLATPDPRYLLFEQRHDPDYGVVRVPYQWIIGQRVYLDVPTVRYVPVDPLPGNPYGRSLAAPSLHTVIFALGLLHDFRRVVQQQGYMRLDISIVLEELQKAIPSNLVGNPEELKRWLDSVIKEVSECYAKLQPDDAYVHTDVVTVNRPAGTLNSDSLNAVDGLVGVLERQAVRAFKTMPLMFGISDGVSEANANRQWEVHAAGIKSLQHLCEALLEHLFTLALRAQGIPARVEFRFAELRAAEKLRDAQVEQLEITNAQAQYDNGWISQDAAAHKGAGVDQADQPKPRVSKSVPTAPPPPDVSTTEPGGNRALTLEERAERGRQSDAGAFKRAYGEKSRARRHAAEEGTRLQGNIVPPALNGSAKHS